MLENFEWIGKLSVKPKMPLIIIQKDRFVFNMECLKKTGLNIGSKFYFVNSGINFYLVPKSFDLPGNETSAFVMGKGREKNSAAMRSKYAIGRVREIFKQNRFNLFVCDPVALYYQGNTYKAFPLGIDSDSFSATKEEVQQVRSVDNFTSVAVEPPIVAEDNVSEKYESLTPVNTEQFKPDNQKEEATELKRKIKAASPKIHKGNRPVKHVHVKWRVVKDANGINHLIIPELKDLKIELRKDKDPQEVYEKYINLNNAKSVKA
jgi:hypothetical protein